MYQFEYVRAGSIGDVESALAGSSEAKILAGGQTLLPALKQRLAQPEKVVDLGAVSGLSGIRQDGSTLVIGAMTTHAEVAASSEVAAAIPALAQLAGGIGDPQVRNRGTIGGSLANNDPSADYPAAVLALNATVVTNKRQISGDDYFQGMFATALEDNEIITEVQFAKPAFAGYCKMEQRASRYPLVGVFVAKPASNPNEVRVAVTGAGADGVFRCTALEQALAANFSSETAKGVSVDPGNLMGDMHGSAEYRAALISVMAAGGIDAGG